MFSSGIDYKVVSSCDEPKLIGIYEYEIINWLIYDFSKLSI